MTRKFYNFLLLFIFIFLVIISPLVINFGKTGKNTKILDHDYSLLSKNEIINKINNDFPMPENLILSSLDRQFTLNSNDINLKIDLKKQVNELLFRRLQNGLYKYIHNFFSSRNFVLSITYDSQALKNKLNQISKEIDKPFIPSEIYIDKYNKIQVKTGELGKKVNLEKLEFEIFSRLSYYNIKDSIIIPIDILGQLPDIEAIENTKKTAQKLITKSPNLQKIHLVKLNRPIIPKVTNKPFANDSLA